MSAFGAIRDQVESIVRGLVDALHAKDDTQDTRLDDLEKRVALLEKAPAPAAKKTAAAPRKTI